MKSLVSALLAGFILFSVSGAQASGRGTADEALALVEKAVTSIAADRLDAFVAINRKDGGFVDRDLYIFVLDVNGNMLAHGANPELIGRNMIDMKLRDVDGKNFIRDFIDVAKTKGEGWVDYKWADPVSKDVAPKSSFVKRSGDMIVGCGIYK